MKKGRHYKQFQMQRSVCQTTSLSIENIPKEDNTNAMPSMRRRKGLDIVSAPEGQEQKRRKEGAKIQRQAVSKTWYGVCTTFPDPCLSLGRDRRT
eukprot:1252039-Amphidinium_carterae.2